MVSALMLSAFGSASITTSFAQENAGSINNNNGSINNNDESLLPTIQITKPTYCTSSINTGKVIVQGAANSSAGISKVEAFVHGYPFNGLYPFLPAHPVSPGNWSSWSMTLDIPTPGTYRILAQATDMSGRQNWDQVVLNVIAPVNASAPIQVGDSSQQGKITNGTLAASPSPPMPYNPPIKKRIAFVDPTFTDAAYTPGGFYDFYFKYNDVPEGTNVTSDLDFMTAQLPKELDRNYYAPLVERVINSNPDAEVSILRDQDVDKGALLNGNGSNAYDVLLLLHNEYVTQKSYDSFKNFVKNGGTIIFLDPNIFYAQVNYNEDTCSVTLVKGHDWEYDGKAVRKSVAERYFDENKEWIGSNFVVRDIKDPVVFGYNPFNYTHFEENYVNNPNAKVLIDYNATIVDDSGGDQPRTPREALNLVPSGILRGILGQNNQQEYPTEEHKTDAGDSENKRIATYELQYGKGKVLMTGIYGQHLVNNTSFLNYFDNVLLTKAIGTPMSIVLEPGNNNAAVALISGTSNSTAPGSNNAFDNINGTTIYSKMNSGVVDKAIIDTKSKILNISLNRSRNVPDNLVIVLPKLLIDPPPSNGTSNKSNTNFTLLLDGSPSAYNRVSDNLETTFIIPLSSHSKVVQISDTQMMPEFSIPQTSLGTTFIIGVIIYALRIIFPRLTK